MGSRQNRYNRLGYIVALMGGLFVLMASGVVPVDDKNLNSPSAIVFLCGVAFMAGGLAVAFPSNRRLKMSMVVLILVSFLIIGLWIAFFGDARHFGGGIPFVSRKTNGTLTRAAFGLGALIVFGMLLMTLKALFRTLSEQNVDPSG